MMPTIAEITRRIEKARELKRNLPIGGR